LNASIIIKYINITGKGFSFIYIFRFNINAGIIRSRANICSDASDASVDYVDGFVLNASIIKNILIDDFLSL